MIWSKLLAQNWEGVKTRYSHMLFYICKQKTSQGRCKMKQQLTVLTYDLLVFCTDISHMVSPLDARSSGKTAGTASNKNSYHRVRTYYVRSTAILAVYLSAHLHFMTVFKEHVNIPTYRQANQGSWRNSNFPKGLYKVNSNARI